MTYRNSLDPGGVPVDGVPDTLTGGVPDWEQITGPQGTINQVGILQTTGFTPTLTHYYLDDSTPPVAQCTGDATAYASSGMYATSTIPNTDPATGGTATLRGTRVMFFESPGGTATDAATRRDQVLAPLATEVAAAP
jgi:hypothetical protein